MDAFKMKNQEKLFRSINSGNLEKVQESLEEYPELMYFIQSSDLHEREQGTKPEDITAFHKLLLSTEIETATKLISSRKILSEVELKMKIM